VAEELKTLLLLYECMKIVQIMIIFSWFYSFTLLLFRLVQTDVKS